MGLHADARAISNGVCSSPAHGLSQCISLQLLCARGHSVHQALLSAVPVLEQPLLATALHSFLIPFFPPCETVIYFTFEGFFFIIRHGQLCKHPEFRLVLCHVFGSPGD